MGNEMQGDKIETDYDGYCALVNQRDKYWEAMAEIVEAYGEMEKGINDEILCHYNGIRLHNAMEGLRALVLDNYEPNYEPSLDPEDMGETRLIEEDGVAPV